MEYWKSFRKYEDVPIGATWYSEKLKSYMIKIGERSQRLSTLEVYDVKSTFVHCWVARKPEHVYFRDLKRGDKFVYGWNDVGAGDKVDQKISRTWYFDNRRNAITSMDLMTKVTKIG